MPDLSHEFALGGVVAGLDEAGRGPLAGPVVAAAVVLDRTRLPARLLDELDDSKLLSARKRDEMFALVQDAALCIGVGRAEVDEIDRINILRATFAAMGRAVAMLSRPIDWALVDGNQKPPLPCPTHCLVGADGLSLSVAAASVVAKVTRDRVMTALAGEFPGYGWERNAGYGTPEHLRALDALGPSPHHRRSFAPVQLAFDLKSS